MNIKLAALQSLIDLLPTDAIAREADLKRLHEETKNSIQQVNDKLAGWRLKIVQPPLTIHPVITMLNQLNAPQLLTSLKAATRNTLQSCLTPIGKQIVRNN